MDTIKEFDITYEGKVVEIIEEIYQDKEHFLSAYSMNPNKVLGAISLHMKVAPYNLEEILVRFHKALVVIKPDDYTPEEA